MGKRRTIIQKCILIFCLYVKKNTFVEISIFNAQETVFYIHIAYH